LLYEAASRGYHKQYIGKLLQEFDLESLPDKQKIPQQTLVEPLSTREIEVLALIAVGKSNREIAAELHISLSTVKGHTSNIYGKLNVNKRTEAVSMGRDLGIID
jgi:LuxR family maltose regulon positive regulatory protein